MDLFGSIPAPIWALAVIAFAFWYIFKRGGAGNKKITLKGLKRLRRQEEASKRQLSIARNNEKIAEIEQKKRNNKREHVSEDRPARNKDAKKAPVKDRDDYKDLLKW
ncbi:hypothetical protein LCGC14_2405600 [marine sediment metagenome]|uniref:Uncharacterized protein n=1 Tax=marine sediment metagenome TaxID=412755 RepID=A0A0F9ENF7_9ZZZZ